MNDYKIRVTNWEKHQHYKKKNKNFNNEQKWFMVYGRTLLREMRFMDLSPLHRDFLLLCWCVGSQDNGFLPDIDQLAFWLRREKKETIDLMNFLLDAGWLEKRSIDEYDLIQEEQEEIIHENRINRVKEFS